MRDRIRFTFAFVGLFILPLVSGAGPVAATSPPPPTYTLIDLGTLGGQYSSARGINARGQIVGMSDTAAGDRHAFLWEAGNGMQDLGTLGGSYSFAQDINERGQVVGESTTVAGDRHAFLWEAGNGMQDLGILGGILNVAWSSAWGINAQGQVVGESTTLSGSGANHAFLWEAGMGMQDLGTLTGSSISGARAINERGQIVGYSGTGIRFSVHAFLWEAGTGMQDLGTLGGLSSTAWDINARGQVVGESTTALGPVLAFLWEAGTGMQDLGTLGGLFSFAYGINARGQVVGESFYGRAFLWEAETGMQDLGTLGGASFAYAINARGQIVGSASTHAVLWEPIGCITPSITSVSATPNLIWPPNHNMVPISVVADAHAVCGPPVCTIVSIASDGPTDRISDDTAITGNLTALVRAERSGGSLGRTYTITVECHDTAGNAATGTTIVRVPHDQGVGAH